MSLALGGTAAAAASASEVTSPADFAVPQLRMIDQHLRCQICQEFFNIAMIIPQCSHNFCSECIRRHLSFTKQKQTYSPSCPTCGVAAVEFDLKPNRTLDDIVTSYKQIRTLLKTKTEEQEEPLSQASDPAAAAAPSSTRSGKRRGRPPGSTKRKRGAGAAAEETDESPLASQASDKAPKTAVDLAEDDEVVVESVKASPKAASVASSAPSSAPSMQECPVCQRFVAATRINQHLDLCLRGLPDPHKDTPAPAKTFGSLTSSLFGAATTASTNGKDMKPGKAAVTPATAAATATAVPQRRQKAKVAYKLLKDKSIRDLLKECHLSTVGDRDTLIRRHEEYLLVYNAQCDAKQPLSDHEIAREVEKRETERSKAKKATDSSSTELLSYTVSTSAHVIAKCQTSYLREHRAEFRRLVEMARKTYKKGPKVTPAPDAQQAEQQQQQQQQQQERPQQQEQVTGMDGIEAAAAEAVAPCTPKGERDVMAAPAAGDGKDHTPGSPSFSSAPLSTRRSLSRRKDSTPSSQAQSSQNDSSNLVV